MQLSPPELMAEEQRDCLERLRRLYDSFGADARLLETDLQGGMQWRRVDGNEYLTRYWPDPDSRSRKKTKTLGRRSPETERQYAEFVGSREKTQQRVKAVEPRVAMLSKAARGMGLGRLPTAHAQHIRRLTRAGLLDDPNLRVVAMGTAAFALYETLYGYLAPARLLRHDDGDDAATFYVGADEIDDDVAERFARALFTLKARVRVRRHSPGCVSVHTLDQSDVSFREVEFVARSTVQGALFDRNATAATVRTVIAAMDDSPLVRGVAVAADSSVLEYAAPDPRAFALASRLVANGGSSPKIDQMIAFKRASAVAWMVRDGIIPLTFTDAHEDALADLGYPNPLLGYDPTFDASHSAKKERKLDADPWSDDSEELDDRLRGP